MHIYTCTSTHKHINTCSSTHKHINTRIHTYLLTHVLTHFFAGMSSGVAMGKHVGGVAEYRSSEGKAVTLPYRGYIKSTINDILGGIRSSCTYVGARYVHK